MQFEKTSCHAKCSTEWLRVTSYNFGRGLECRPYALATSWPNIQKWQIFGVISATFFRPLLGFITFACYAELINVKDEILPDQRMVHLKECDMYSEEEDVFRRASNTAALLCSGIVFFSGAHTTENSGKHREKCVWTWLQFEWKKWAGGQWWRTPCYKIV